MIKESVKANALLGNQPYKTTLTSGGFTLVADEPSEKGGTDQGPTPDMLLCMSLASCTAITLHMYAARKQWDIGNLNIEVELLTNEDGSRFFQRAIHSTQILEDAVRERLITVANKCPVHKILSNANTIETVWPVA